MATSLPTFGVTYAGLEGEFSGFTFTGDSTWETRIDGWIQDASGQVVTLLRKQGVEYASVTESGEPALFNVCKRFVTSWVARKIGQTTTHDNPDLSEDLTRELSELRKIFASDITGLLVDHDRKEQRGAFREIRRRRRARRPGGVRWRKGMPF